MDDLQRQAAPITSRDVAQILRRRAPIALFTFVLIVGLTSLMTSRMQPKYEAQARLLIDNPAAGGAAVPTNLVDLMRAGGQNSTDVELEKIRSRKFLEEILKRLGTPNIPADALRGKLLLDTSAGGQILKIGARTETPEEARKIANTVSEAYIDLVRNEFNQKTGMSEERLVKAGNEALEEKQRAEKALNAFTSRTGLSNPGLLYNDQVTRTIGMRNQLADSIKNLPLLEKNLANYREQIKNIPETIVNGYSLNKNGIIDSYKDEITRLETKRTDQSFDFALDSPEIKDIDNQILARKNALTEVENGNDKYSQGSKGVSLNPDHTSLQTRIYETEIAIKSTRQNIAALKVQVASMEGDQRRLTAQETAYNTLRRAFDSSNEAWEKTRSGLLALRQTKVTSGPFIRVLDEAQLPAAPVSPNKTLNLVLALGLGLTFAIGMALLAEFLSGRGLVSMDFALPQVGGVPLLGTLPIVLPAPLRSGSAADLPAPLQTPGAALAEDTLREIGYFLSHREPKGPVPVVLLTGTRSDDSTAILAAQLTATLVREGIRVTLVDADRQKPRLNRVFGAPDAPGLADALAQRRPVNEILHIGANGALRFLAAGAPSDNVPLTEKDLRLVFRKLADAGETDVVLVSGPTVWSVRQVAPLEKASSGMVLLSSGDAATADESVARVRRLLSNGYKPRLLGVVQGNNDDSLRSLSNVLVSVRPPDIDETEEVLL